MKKHLHTLLTTFAAFAISALANAAPIVYEININTSDVLGQTVLADFQFNPAVVPVPAGTATVTLFSPAVGLGAVDLIEGAVTGDLASSLFMQNTTTLNLYSQTLTLGALITFRVGFDGAFLAPGVLDGTAFSFSLLEQGSFNPLLSTSLALFTFDIVDGGVTITDTSTPVGNNDRVTVRAINDLPVPAPAVVLLLLVGFVGLQRTKRCVR